MRITGLIVVTLLGTLVSSARGADRLIVHEWGTFTNFAGADGVYMDYRPLVGSDLPAFVFDRARQTKLTKRIRAFTFSKGSMVKRSRMETPITYFYSDRPLTIRARVDFPHGLLTEFYPPAFDMAPLATAVESTPPPMGHSFLDWGSFTITPVKDQPTDNSKLPRVENTNAYAAARETDSDIVHVENILGVQEEKFLFYRGVGNFDLPVTLRSLGDNRFSLSHSGGQPIRGAVLVQLRDRKLRFTRVGAVDHDTLIELPTATGTVEQLSDTMAEILTDQGLYPKEARAMVNTWKASWFGEEGTRLLYLLPQRFTDAELPLQITPTPQVCLRVMVGRIEVLTPEVELRVKELFRQSAANDCAAREEALRQLHELGRFAEPALHYALRNSSDSLEQERLESILDVLRSQL